MSRLTYVGLYELLTLLQILAASPAPDGPQWMIRLPMSARMGWASLKDSSDPPTRKESVPAWAPVTPVMYL